MLVSDLYNPFSNSSTHNKQYRLLNGHVSSAFGWQWTTHRSSYIIWIYNVLRMLSKERSPALAGLHGTVFLHSWRTRGLPWTLARCSLKCFPFPTLSQSAPQLRMFLLEFRDEVNREETSHWAGLLRGESCMMLTSIVFDSSTRAADRRMDGRYSICCRALKIIIIRLCREAFEVWRHLH